MRLFRAPVIALAALCAAHCTPAPVSNEGARSEPLPQPTAAEPSGKLVRFARIEGYANPVTGEMWMRGVETLRPKLRPASGVAAAALRERPGFCEVAIESDGKIGGNEHATFEWFTWGTIDSARSDCKLRQLGRRRRVLGPRRPADPERASGVREPLQPGRALLPAAARQLHRQGVRPHLFRHRQFTGDPGNQVPFPPGYGDGSLVGPAYSFAPEFPGDWLRNAPSSDFGMWDFGPVADGQEIDMWMFFQNRVSTDYRWERLPDRPGARGLRGLRRSMPDDDDCDGVINNGCGEFAQGEACFIDDDCESGELRGRRAFDFDPVPWWPKSRAERSPR